MAGFDWSRVQYGAQQEDDKPWYNDAYEVGRQFAAGTVVDLPRMAGQAARWVAQDGTAVDRWGRESVEAADARAPGWEPDMQGRGALATPLIKGIRAVPPMAPAIAAGFVPGGQWVAPAVAAAQFGASSAQDTEDKLRLQGVSDADASRAGWVTGAIQGPLEGAATAVGLRMFKPLMGAATTAGVAAKLTDTAVLKPLAKGMALNLVTQPTTEVAQDVLTELNERSYGAAPEDLGQITKDSAQGGLGLAMLLGPFAAGGQVRRSRSAGQLGAALNSSDPMLQAQARDFVVEQANRQGVTDSEAWLDQQFMADDARTQLLKEQSESAIQARLEQARNGVPQAVMSRDVLDRSMGIGAPGMSDKDRAAYADQFEQAACVKKAFGM